MNGILFNELTYSGRVKHSARWIRRAQTGAQEYLHTHPAGCLVRHWATGTSAAARRLAFSSVIRTQTAQGSHCQCVSGWTSGHGHLPAALDEVGSAVCLVQLYRGLAAAGESASTEVLAAHALADALAQHMYGTCLTDSRSVRSYAVVGAVADTLTRWGGTVYGYQRTILPVYQRRAFSAPFAGAGPREWPDCTVRIRPRWSRQCG